MSIRTALYCPTLLLVPLPDHLESLLSKDSRRCSRLCTVELVSFELPTRQHSTRHLSVQFWALETIYEECRVNSETPYKIDSMSALLSGGALQDAITAHTGDVPFANSQPVPCYCHDLQ